MLILLRKYPSGSHADPSSALLRVVLLVLLLFVPSEAQSPAREHFCPYKAGKSDRVSLPGLAAQIEISDVPGRAGLKSPGLGRALPGLGLSECKARPAQWAWAGPGPAWAWARACLIE